MCISGSDDFPGDDDEAEKWLGAASDQGLAEATNLLGVLYLHPYAEDRTPDPARAFTYFEQAANEGSVFALANLGDMYLEGTGVAKDRETAKSLYLQAARAGNLEARLRLYEHFSITVDDTEEVPKKPKTKQARTEENQAPAKETVVSVRPPARPRTSKPSPVNLFPRLSQSVFRLVVVKGKEQPEVGGLGSAVAITRDLAITNCHVIEDMDAYGTKIGDKVTMFRYVGGSKKRDVCAIRAQRALSPVAQIRRYDDLKVGEQVYAIGSPRGLSNTMSEGLISGLRERDGVRLIQTSAATSPGSSRGGLFDDEGRLIGITSFGIVGGESLNFAVAIDEALPFITRAR